MVIRGIRKHFNNDPEAQMASIEAAKLQRRQEHDALRLRYSISWYNAKGGLWSEIEAISLDLPVVWKVTFTFHEKKPERRVSTWGLKKRETGEFLPFESGFIGDGLSHPVWTNEGRLVHNRRLGEFWLEFDREKSKYKMHAQLVTGIGALPDLFWELYGLRVSIPQIQEAYRQYLIDEEG
jgi:hypothetical protein